MLRSSLLAATSALVLSACQPAADAPTDTVVAETPPVVSEAPVETAAETAETIEVAAVDNEPSEVESETDDEHGEEVHDDHDHEGEKNDDHAHHDHDDEHGDDHEAHDHDEEDHHDHDDHDHAGGEAHVHGLTDMAVSIDGNTVSISLDGALANFDLDETLRTLDDSAPYTDGVVALVGGDCTQDDAVASIRPIGDHGNLMVDLTYTCAALESLEAIDVIAFERFTGFEDVDAVVLNESAQSASTLTRSSGRLDLR